MAQMTVSDPTAILEFWFGAANEWRSEWFRKDERFDTSVRERFGALVAQALAGGLSEWTDTAPGALARVLLLDQFTRNIFRGTARAFDGDALALAAARTMVERNQDAALAPLRRVFVYLPFEHAEDAVPQLTSLRLFRALTKADASLADFEDYAQRHAEVIERFGRFPHRNAVLGRTSTPREQTFLRQPGSSF
jgi:uncharacterized protein (DUF924 family)